MHELSIVESLVRLAEDELDRNGCKGTVKALNIKVGLLSGANPDALEFAFEVVSENSLLKGSFLNITRIKPILVCNECNKSYEIEELTVVCPKCGSSEIKITGGDELALESIEIGDNEESNNAG